MHEYTCARVETDGQGRVVIIVARWLWIDGAAAVSARGQAAPAEKLMIDASGRTPSAVRACVRPQSLGRRSGR